MGRPAFGASVPGYSQCFHRKGRDKGMNVWQQLAARLPDGQSAALITSPHNRRYLTGFPSSDGCVLVTREAAYFLTDFRYIEAAQRRIREMECRCYRRMRDEVQELLTRHGIGRLYVEADAVTLAEKTAFFDKLSVEIGGDGSLDGWLTELRLVKTPAQLEKIRQAQALTEYGFEKILPAIRPGRTEREIALELEFAIRRAGAEGVAFEFIVVSGANSSLPHGVPSDKEIEPGDFVTMDFGAVVDGWHSDMTRTVAVGRVSDKQRAVYATVFEAQRAALETLKAGLSCVEGDAAARRVIEAAGYGDCFGHGTGHGVGMEIHEAPRLSPSAGEETLREGSVVTVEPGIYLPGEFGVRIEDMVVITRDGCEDLTQAPKDLLVL